jgi:hypothetical protein
MSPMTVREGHTSDQSHWITPAEVPGKSLSSKIACYCRCGPSGPAEGNDAILAGCGSVRRLPCTAAGRLTPERSFLSARVFCPSDDLRQDRPIYPPSMYHVLCQILPHSRLRICQPETRCCTSSVQRVPFRKRASGTGFVQPCFSGMLWQKRADIVRITHAGSMYEIQHEH